MIALLASQRDRAIDAVLCLDRERIDWIALYFEWDMLGLFAEAAIALENIRIVRRHILWAHRVARFWIWIAGART